MSQACFVYALFDPRTLEPFYIGISNNPWYRFYTHCHDRCSAAWDFLQFLTENCGFDRIDIMAIVKECPTRREALDIEYELVTSIPGLLNRPYRKGRAY